MTMLSIVTGTYNRKAYLESMIGSARKAAGGLALEFVIVDGGSTDGTQKWCKLQPDVVLIEHGKLLGAVKAFNDGARKATGKYVILANDDIVFLEKSILAAISFIQDHAEVGIGAFYQDRGGRDWHVEEQSVVINGLQKHLPYGQVCIIPKELGDQVGWWGDYLRTYGGDNELSSNVMELGYKVLPIPCAYIHDDIPQDNLRFKNNEEVQVPGKNHPDTQAWLDKWTRDGLVGPVIPINSWPYAK